MPALNRPDFVTLAKLSGVELFPTRRGWLWATTESLDRAGGPDAYADIRGPFMSDAAAAANALAELHIAIH